MVKKINMMLVAMMLWVAGVQGALKQEDLLAMLFEGVFAQNKNDVSGAIKAGANVNGKSWVGDTPLHYAAALGNVEIATLLVTQGADVNAKSHEDIRPLHFAVEAGKTDMIKFLLTNKADVNAQNNYGYAALHAAAYLNDVGLATLLLNNGANVNIKSKQGVTPLLMAVDNEKKDVAQFLIDNKADVNASDLNGDTPLHKAAADGNIDVVNLLIKNKANVNAKNTGEVTPFLSATGNGHVQVVLTLLENGADVSGIKDQNGNTPLHAAVDKDNAYLVEILIKGKANVNAQNNMEQTPLDVMCHKTWKIPSDMPNRVAIHKMLRGKGAKININARVNRCSPGIASSRDQNEFKKLWE